MTDPGDDDKTPPGRPRRRAQTATERDLEGMRARAERHAAAEASLESERTRLHRERKALRTHPHGVPAPPSPDMVERELSGTIDVPLDLDEAHEPTKPWEVLDRKELRPEEARIVQRSKRESGDPIFVEDWAKLMARVEKLMARLALKEITEERRADEYMKILDTTPSGRMAARVAELERASKDADKDADLRLKTLEKDATFARNAAMSTLVFLILAIGGAGIWLGIREEKLSNVIDSVKDLDREVKRIRWSPSKDNTP